jgi:STE24 endopeptidase
MTETTPKKFNLNRIKAYSSLKHRVYFLGLILNLGMLLIFILSGLSADLRNILMNISVNFYLKLIIFYLTFSLAFFILGLPLDYYDGYSLEQRYDLSTQNKKEWLLDNLKKFGVSLVIGLILITALYYLLRNFYNIWWILAAVFYFLFSVLMAKVMPVVILPLFYKQKPLKSQELKDRLLKLAQKTGQSIKDVFEIDLSRETKKANAALVGSGNTRRILLADTLLKKYTDEEIEVILAHELAHHALKHMRLILIFGGVISIGIFFIVNKLLYIAVNSGAINSISDITALPLILLIFSALSLLISPLQNAFTRKLETDADRYALKLTNLNQAFISAMEKLTEQNLSDPEPSRFIEIMLYDHPPVTKRIKLANQ